LNVEWGFYKLRPDKNWEIDLADLESKIDAKTKAILVNNPSNPCGSCWTREHQEAILAVADKHKIPLICDEVYHGLSFDEERPFHSFGNISTNVPIICCSAISKIYCVPGWRLGWSIIYNHHGYFDKVVDHMGKQSMILLHPCSLVQAALPKILSDVPQSHFDNMKSKLKEAATVAYDRFSKIPGLIPVQSSAAMYMMVRIDIDHFADIADDVDFVKKLLAEQNAFCFPSTCFYEKNMFRVVLCTRPETIVAFGDRLEAFCASHAKH
jgi:tyrosine aminotransferase